MKKMTYAVAIENAIGVLSLLDSTECDRDETIACLEALRESLAKRSNRSDEAKAKQNAKRKEKTAKERAALMEQVLPILRECLSQSNEGMTAKELYESCAESLPEGFTASKVQYILLHEMADEVVKTEKKGKPNIYQMKG